MRSGNSVLQQTLTSEAASVLKHCLVLARRRGHAQVTPLHVATTLLTLRVSSFRRACLKSQPHQTSHPLQCRALELCFNVALDRLPTTPSPLIHSQPSLSNALIAALKRAQAHQRRGSNEQQQQLPTVKVKLEQLIISILDDPSVSRVMREAGFSSTLVKNNIEDSCSVSAPNSVFQSYKSSSGVFSSPCSPSTSENHRENIITIKNSNFRQNHFMSEFNPVFFSPPKKATVYPITGADSSSSDKDDIKLVLDILLRKKTKNIVLVGDSVSLTERLVGKIMGKFERSEVPDELKSTSFIKFYQLTPVSLRYMKRDEVEMKLLELKMKVDSIPLGDRSCVFYIGDLKWIVELACEKEEGFSDGEVCGYNPAHHVVSEIGKLFSEGGNSKAKVWLMATSSYQTYMRCQLRQPSLEMQWALQALPVPSGGLGLTLHASSVYDSKMTISHHLSHMLETKPFSNKEDEDKLKCCEECAINYQKEAQFLIPSQKKTLPLWLQSQTTEYHKKDELTELERKWNNRLCHCLHQNKQHQNHWNSSNPNKSSGSISFANNASKPNYNNSNLVPRFRRQQLCTIEFNFSDKKQATEQVFGSLGSMEGKEVQISLGLGNGGSGEMVGNITDTKLQQAHVCKLLQENVPWQSENLPSIAKALTDSKSLKQSNIKWLLLQGNDSIGKKRLALAVAESVVGSAELLLHLDMLKKETSTTPFSEKLEGALRTHQKLVILIESFDFADAQFIKFLLHGYETGKFGNLSISGQVIFILTKGGSTRVEEQNQNSVMKLLWQISETKPNLDTPYSGHKRGAELELLSNIKSPRIEEKEKGMIVSKDFSRQSSFNTLDLNMKADEEENETGDTSPISSDLTREAIADPLNTNVFLDSIENRFEFETSSARDREIAGMFLSKIKRSFEEVCGKQYVVNFSVDERVIEDMCVECCFLTNSLFEKWLKEIFQSSLETVKIGGKEEGILYRLCWGGKGKGDTKWDSGFMYSSLPKSIQVNYFTS